MYNPDDTYDNFEMESSMEGVATNNPGEAMEGYWTSGKPSARNSVLSSVKNVFDDTSGSSDQQSVPSSNSKIDLKSENVESFKPLVGPKFHYKSLFTGKNSILGNPIDALSMIYSKPLPNPTPSIPEDCFRTKDGSLRRPDGTLIGPPGPLLMKDGSLLGNPFENHPQDHLNYNGPGRDRNGPPFDYYDDIGPIPGGSRHNDNRCGPFDDRSFRPYDRRDRLDSRGERFDDRMYRNNDRRFGYNDRIDRGNDRRPVYNNDRMGGFSNDRRGGFNNDRRGGFNNDRREVFNNGQMVGFNNDRRTGFNNERMGGFSNDRMGGFNNDRMGGFNNPLSGYLNQLGGKFNAFGLPAPQLARMSARGVNRSNRPFESEFPLAKHRRFHSPPSKPNGYLHVPNLGDKAGGNILNYIDTLLEVRRNFKVPKIQFRRKISKTVIEATFPSTDVLRYVVQNFSPFMMQKHKGKTPMWVTVSFEPPNLSDSSSNTGKDGDEQSKKENALKKIPRRPLGIFPDGVQPLKVVMIVDELNGYIDINVLRETFEVVTGKNLDAPDIMKLIDERLGNEEDVCYVVVPSLAYLLKSFSIFGKELSSVPLAPVKEEEKPRKADEAMESFMAEFSEFIDLMDIECLHFLSAYALKLDLFKGSEVFLRHFLYSSLYMRRIVKNRTENCEMIFCEFPEGRNDWHWGMIEPALLKQMDESRALDLKKSIVRAIKLYNDFACNSWKLGNFKNRGKRSKYIQFDKLVLEPADRKDRLDLEPEDVTFDKVDAENADDPRLSLENLGKVRIARLEEDVHFRNCRAKITRNLCEAAFDLQYDERPRTIPFRRFDVVPFDPLERFPRVVRQALEKGLFSEQINQLTGENEYKCEHCGIIIGDIVDADHHAYSISFRKSGMFDEKLAQQILSFENFNVLKSIEGPEKDAEMTDVLDTEMECGGATDSNNTEDINVADEMTIDSKTSQEKDDSNEGADESKTADDIDTLQNSEGSENSNASEKKEENKSLVNETADEKIARIRRLFENPNNIVTDDDRDNVHLSFDYKRGMYYARIIKVFPNESYGCQICRDGKWPDMHEFDLRFHITSAEHRANVNEKMKLVDHGNLLDVQDHWSLIKKMSKLPPQSVVIIADQFYQKVMEPLVVDEDKVQLITISDLFINESQSEEIIDSLLMTMKDIQDVTWMLVFTSKIVLDVESKDSMNRLRKYYYQIQAKMPPSQRVIVAPPIPMNLISFSEDLPPASYGNLCDYSYTFKVPPGRAPSEKCKFLYTQVKSYHLASAVMANVANLGSLKLKKYHIFHSTEDLPVVTTTPWHVAMRAYILNCLYAMPTFQLQHAADVGYEGNLEDVALDIRVKDMRIIGNVPAMHRIHSDEEKKTKRPLVYKYNLHYTEEDIIDLSSRIKLDESPEFTVWYIHCNFTNLMMVHDDEYEICSSADCDTKIPLWKFGDMNMNMMKEKVFRFYFSYQRRVLADHFVTLLPILPMTFVHVPAEVDVMAHAAMHEASRDEAIFLTREDPDLLMQVASEFKKEWHSLFLQTHAHYYTKKADEFAARDDLMRCVDLSTALATRGERKKLLSEWFANLNFLLRNFDCPFKVERGEGPKEDEIKA